MLDQNSNQNKPTPTLEYSGVLLGLLANAVVSIKSTGYNGMSSDYLKWTFCAAIFFLVLSMLLEFVLTQYKTPKHDREKLLECSHYCFLFGLLITASIIILIIAELTLAMGLLGFLIVSIAVIKHITKKRPETEERLSSCKITTQHSGSNEKPPIQPKKQKTKGS